MRSFLKVAGPCAVVLALCAGPASGQTAPKFEILDNSFLVEEAFNQEAHIYQNIGTWVVDSAGDWQAVFTQEWPVGGETHQFSYTLPVLHAEVAHIGDVLIHYRYQLQDEDEGRPAIAPRVSLVLPTSRARDGNRKPGLQANIPISQQFGGWYLHANAGFTWLPGIETTVPQLAGSAIRRIRPMFHLMAEVLLEEAVLTLSPGFRAGWNIGNRQVVVGAAVPVTPASEGSRVAVLTYFSYELPFP